MRMPSASASASARSDRSRASSIRPWCAAISAAGNSAIGCAPSRPNCARSASESAAWRAPSSQFPARHSRTLSSHSAAPPRGRPARSGLRAALRGVGRARSSSPDQTSWNARTDVASPVSGPCGSDRSSASASSICSRGMPRPPRKCRNPKVASALHRSAASPARDAASTASSACSDHDAVPP